ncbi:hypothetical protein JW916_03675 [Candidatus Sumerlaeota bacterium]|nr:hypothetical protein [Candidatus Sumerlaeota bacterium]
MSAFWKIKAWFHHWVSKIFWVLAVVGIVFVCLWMRGPILSVWDSILRAMTF